MKKLLGNILKTAGKGAPVIDSIRKAIVAFHEGKFDPKKLLWLFAEATAALLFLWAVLYIGKTYDLSADQVIEYIKSILTLGLG